MTLGRFVLARVLYSVPVLVGVTVIVFLSLQLVPGDVARTLLGFSASEERVVLLREQLGLDDPLILQYARWFWNVLGGDLGTSIAQQLPVSSILFPKMVNSLILMLASFLLVVGVGFVFAVVSAANFRKAVDKAIVGFTMVLASLPVFWLGILLLYFFGVRWKIFPISGMYNMADPGGLFQLLSHLVLPAVTTAASSIAVVTRVSRSALIDVLSQPYIVASTARGLSRQVVVLKHGVRNMLPVFANISGLQIGYLFGSAIFSEIIFNWPGIGLQLYDAILARDVPMIQGCIIVVAVVFVLGNLLSDVVAHALDPRQR